MSNHAVTSVQGDDKLCAALQIVSVRFISFLVSFGNANFASMEHVLHKKICYGRSCTRCDGTYLNFLMIPTRCKGHL